MDRQQNESEIKELFREIRRHDEGAVPSFRTVTSEAGKVGRTSTFGWWNLKTAVALILVAAVISPVAWNLLRTPETPQPEVLAELGSWQAPTDFLLNFSGDALGASVPDIESDLTGWILEDPTAGQEDDS
jgi:hypothetical protein